MREMRTITLEQVDWDRPRIHQVSTEAISIILKSHLGYWDTRWDQVMGALIDVKERNVEDVVLRQADDVLAVVFHPPQDFIEKGLEDDELTYDGLRSPYIKVDASEINEVTLRYCHWQELTKVTNLMRDMSSFFQLGWQSGDEFKLTFPKEVYACDVREVEAVLVG